ncbi:hypothetical protein BJF93_07080 [Xaviernesmea oryzae]|uniref:MAPEG family protein n=1 Tax=Xaviernesmea oryzae TaxID=464029 RepID=A0A1Q9B3N7_9HYPH|nr:MAPEG family protein [Xaviernesmea oryzae]OLP62645.1 hypothetical protein BJF93_07080 [Xaviernesmea oryzae]SEM27888.1 MAPEG family protein [Xaviernesmea oryzae]
MTTADDFKREQRDVLFAMVGAFVLTIGILGAVLMRDYGGAPVSFPDRLRFALRADLFLAIWPAAAIGNIARLRFLSQRDIAGSSATGGSEEVRTSLAILQNTIEQAVLALMTHMVVAASFQRSDALLVALVLLFAIGRLLFWIGYKHGARGRAFGFALTFYPSIVSLLASATAIVFDSGM